MPGDVKFSLLPPAALLTGTEIVPVIQGGNGVHTTVSGFGTYNPPGVGAVSRTYAAAIAQLVTSVIDYGADPTGLTNSYPAFLAAYNYAVFTGGGNIFVPVGNYRLNSTLVMTSSFVNLLGEGPGSLIINGQTNAPAIQLGNGGARIFKIDVRNIGFGQAAGVTAVAGNCGLLANGIGQCRIDDLFVANSPQALYQGIVLNNATQIIFHANQVYNCLNTGIYLKGNCIDFYATDSHSDGNGQNGWQIEDCQGIYAVNCTAFNCTANGWNIQTAGPNGNVNHFYTNCIGDTSGIFNWFIGQLFKATLASCWGSTQQSITVNTFGTGFLLQGPNTADIQFHGGFALNNNSHGVQLTNSGGVPSNIRFNNFTSGSSAGGAQGNGKAAGGGYGIAVDNACTNIRFDGGALASNATGPVSLGSSGTIINNAPVGYINENGGVAATVADGGTISHGLAAQPTRISLTGTNAAANNIITASNQSSTTITVAIKTTAGASGTAQNIYWTAKI